MPAALVTAGFGTAVYAALYHGISQGFSSGRTPAEAIAEFQLHRPAVLVVAFAAVLFVPALSDYFGLTGPAMAVFTIVLPALVLWFVTLGVVLRFRLSDRILAIGELPDRR